MYSITPLLNPYKNNHGLHLITFQIIVDRVKLNIKSTYKVKESQFKNGIIIKHENAEKYNYQLKKQKLELENKLLDAFKHQSIFTKPELDRILKGKHITGESFEMFAEGLIIELQGKYSAGRLKHYKTVLNKVLAFNLKAKISEINSNWLQRFENYLRSTNISNNTIRSNVKIIKAMMRFAKQKGVIKELDFSAYKNIKVAFKEPDFLNEHELKSFAEVCKEVDQLIIKIPGYYFLLSCYTGLRIGDVLSFKESMVQNDEVIVYAQKNKKRSGVPLFTDLKEVIEFIKVHPCKYHQKTVRESVKKIALMAGIRKNVKYHTSRHTFCSRMLQLGFTIPEVADMAGDTIETISKTYAHVDKKALNKKVKELLG